MKKLLVFLLMSIAAHATSYRMLLYDCKGNTISSSRMKMTVGPILREDTFDESHYMAAWEATKLHMSHKPVTTVCYVSLHIKNSHWCIQEEGWHFYKNERTWFRLTDTLTVVWKITRWVEIDPNTHVASVHIKFGPNI